MRRIEKVQVTRDELKRMTEVIKTKVRSFNPESGQGNGYTYTNDGVNGYIIQSNNIVLHKADGSLKCWFAK